MTLAAHNITASGVDLVSKAGQGLTPIPEKVLRKNFPAVYGRQAAGMSQAYSFIKTGMLIDALIEEGWVVTNAFQPRPQKRDPSTVQHVVKLHHASDIERLLAHEIADAPVMVLHNSGNGRSKLRASYGVYRFWCSNGLVLGKTLKAIAMIHQGLSKSSVADLLREFAVGSAEVSALMAKMRGVDLDESARRAMARSAIALRTGRTLEEAERDFDLDATLKPVRTSDEGTDLWTTFNVLQERVMHGALPLRTGGRGRVVSAVRDTLNGHAINEALWELAAARAA